MELVGQQDVDVDLLDRGELLAVNNWEFFRADDVVYRELLAPP